MHRVVPLGLTIIAMGWVVALVIAPVAMARGILPGPVLAVYQAGSLVCHQRAERSFHLAGVQTPVCGRCLGLYLAAPLGAVAAQSGRRRRTTITPRVALALSALPMIFSLAAEWSGLANGSNLTRFASAVPFGAAAAWTIVGQLVPFDGPRETRFR